MITTCVTNAGRLAFLRGEIKPSNVFKIALYTKEADLDKSLSSVPSKGEAKGAGYVRKALAAPVYGVKDDVAYMDFPGDIQWLGATISADGCLIYDETTGTPLVVVAFGATISSTNAPFTLEPDTDTIRFA